VIIVITCVIVVGHAPDTQPGIVVVNRIFGPQVNMQAIPTAANRSNVSKIRIVVRTHIMDFTVSKPKVQSVN
jgi:hypothetical protein